MEVEQVLCMNGGNGKTSYANNSIIQKRGMRKANPMLEESISKLFCSTSISYPKCLNIADLGCSSGPNTLSLVRKIIDIVDETCQKLNRKTPMFQVFLNDLHGNDFNTVFKSLPNFLDRLKKEKGSEFGPCFIAGIPGSFYGRLFPDNSLHFVHSSYSLHWRSQAPEGLMNKGNIYVTKKSHPSVHKAYLNLFEADFILFLKSRSQEMVPGGQMLLTIIGDVRKSNFPGDTNCTVWELLGDTLHDMVLEGLIEEEKLDRFSLPYYAPTPEEVREVVENEGSFEIQRFEMYKMDWNGNGESETRFRGKNVATSIRAICESLLATHFSGVDMDCVFQRYGRKVGEYLEMERGQCTTIAISMTKAF